jgi:hypothetical protein
MKKRILLFGIFALSIHPLLASAIRRGDVPADAPWVAHFDCDGLKKTKVGAAILDQLQKPEADAKFHSLEAMFGFDPRKQLHGVTFFGAEAGSKDGVAVIYADFDADRLATIAKGANGYESNDYKGTTIHNWIDEKKRAKDGVKPRVYAATAGKRLIIGPSEALIQHALDALAHAVPTLDAANEFSSLGTGHCFFQAAGHHIDLPASDPNALALKMARLITFDAREKDDSVELKLAVEAKDEDIAGPLMSIGQGLIGLAKLQKNKPEVAKLANSIKLERKAANVTAGVSIPSADVIEMVKAGASKKPAKKERD